MTNYIYPKQPTFKDVLCICTIKVDGGEKQEKTTVTLSYTDVDSVREALKAKFQNKILAYRVEKITLTKEFYQYEKR